MQTQFFEQAPLIRKGRKPRSERQIQRDIEAYLISREAVWTRTDCSYYSPYGAINRKEGHVRDGTAVRIAISGTPNKDRAY